jgi:pyridoxamine 5'-phosphate oxidase
VSTSPLATLAEWIDDARRAGLRDPDAMALATATPRGAPSVRIVLCKGVEEAGVRFFTNYESRKGRQIADNPHASAVFFWATLERQVRVEGRVVKLSAEESDAYFRVRPRGSRLASAVSPQSQPIVSLDDLRARCDDLDSRLAGADVPRPAHWGGYRLDAESVELWRAGDHRLHDRVLYVRSEGGWDATRLAP